MWGKYSFLWLQKHLQTWVCSLKICCFLLLCVGQAACLSLCGYLPVPVCVCGIVLGGITFEVLFALLWPPKWKSFDAPFLITPPSITNIHTHTHKLGVGMICRFRCSATLLPILASFRHRQHFLPLSSTPGRDTEEGELRGRKYGRC